MPSKLEVLQELLQMSQWLGEESRQFSIFAEGNTSAWISDETFYVKASGCHLENLSETEVVEMDVTKVLEMLDGGTLSGEEIKTHLRAAMIDKDGPLLPSIETLFHAYLLSIPGVRFVGHTHPVSVNSILCSKDWRDATRRRLTPEEVLCCGAEPAYVEYSDPGVPLGRRMRAAVEEYIERLGTRPKAILMQNHGLVALGRTAREVQSITGIWDKTARILAGTFHFGGPNYLREEAVARLSECPEDLQHLRLTQGR
jgi:rhamnose utilization protein RhaD (predicted bifunctional aldolase and dehydrogenase)